MKKTVNPSNSASAATQAGVQPNIARIASAAGFACRLRAATY